MEKGTQKIVVMGGSFNPPTVAHYRLMMQAIETIKADIGYFVPVSDAYLKRKMSHSHPPVVLSEALRVRMLQSMCTDGRMQVCEKERGAIEARTMPTLTAIQEEHPQAELYFVMGADKLDLLVHLTEKWQFLSIFRVALFAREEGATGQALASDELLSGYRERIVVMSQPEGTEGVSSSLVRERMLRGESSEDLLCPGVWELFREFTAADFPDAVTKFKGDYAFLDNRFSCTFTWQGLEYHSAEAAFHASKSRDEKERKVYAGCSVEKAALKGREQTPYKGWEEERLAIMESILEAKFGQDAILMQKLAATGNSTLINGNNKQETYWGVDLYSWEGENHLGRILMNIRAQGIQHA